MPKMKSKTPSKPESLLAKFASASKREILSDAISFLNAPSAYITLRGV